MNIDVVGAILMVLFVVAVLTYMGYSMTANCVGAHHLRIIRLRIAMAVAGVLSILLLYADIRFYG